MVSVSKNIRGIIPENITINYMKVEKTTLKIRKYGG